MKYKWETSYMKPEIYHNYMKQRKKWFIIRWESKHWLSWNLQQQLAYNACVKETGK